MSHHLLAYFWMLSRDRERFAFAARQCSRLPLGAGALAGVNFETDRQLVAEELGFSEPAPNSIDAVANRDFALDYLNAAATCATHLSRLGAELVLWSSAEFAFCELPDAWSAGSSIMPQKKNPDAAELLRAKAPRVVAHLAGLHGVMHALPLTYNKDLQEDKEHVFDTSDTLELALAAALGMISGVSFHRARLAEAASDELIAATDVADLLVRRGMPFREAHGVVASLVRLAVDSGRPLSELTPEELSSQSVLLATTAEYYKVLARDSWLESKVSVGGTALRPRAARAVRAGGARELARTRSLLERTARASAQARCRDFYARPVLEVAHDLIGCVVEHDGMSGLIVETEAYHESEPACHAFVGITPRTRTLYEEPGHRLRLPLLRHPRAAERGLRAARAWAPPC